jgi:hypothetical protein
VIMAAIDGRLEGAFAVADAVRPTSMETVKRLDVYGHPSRHDHVDYIQRRTASTVSLGLVLKHIFEDGGAF